MNILKTHGGITVMWIVLKTHQTKLELSDSEIIKRTGEREKNMRRRNGQPVSLGTVDWWQNLLRGYPRKCPAADYPDRTQLHADFMPFRLDPFKFLCTVSEAIHGGKKAQCSLQFWCRSRKASTN